MFRSNGRQENHIFPQVDCRMVRAGLPGKQHVDLVPCVRLVGAHRGADRATPTSALALNERDLEADVDAMPVVASLPEG
jgi:hypothetical protein